MTVWSECVLYVVERSDCVRPRMVTSGPASASGGQPTWTLRAFNCVMGRVCVGGEQLCVCWETGWELRLESARLELQSGWVTLGTSLCLSDPHCSPLKIGDKFAHPPQVAVWYLQMLNKHQVLLSLWNANESCPEGLCQVGVASVSTTV